MDKIILQSIIISIITLHKYISHNSAVMWKHFQPITVTLAAVKLVKRDSIQECPIDRYGLMIRRRSCNFRSFYQTCHTAQKHKEICQPHSLDTLNSISQLRCVLTFVYILKTDFAKALQNNKVTSMVWITSFKNEEKNRQTLLTFQLHSATLLQFDKFFSLKCQEWKYDFWTKNHEKNSSNFVDI